MIPLTKEEALSAWDTLDVVGGENDLPALRAPYKHYHPLVDAADMFVREAQTTKRFYTGVPQFDEQMRGWGPGHLAIIGGYCMTPSHEVLTPNGWVNHEALRPGDQIWTVNPTTQTGEWDVVEAVNVFDHNGPLNRLLGKNIDAFVTDNHKWAVRAQHTDQLKVKLTTELNTSDYIPCAIEGNDPAETLADAYLRILAWIFTEGTYDKSSITIYQSPRVNADKCAMIEADLAALGWKYSVGHRVRESGSDENSYRIAAVDGNPIQVAFPDKMATTELVDAMSVRQRRMFIDVLILGDGHIANTNGTRRYVTARQAEAAVTAHLFAAAGVAFSERRRKWQTPYGVCEMSIFTERKSKNVRYARINHTQEHYSGIVWCPTTSNGIILARSDGKVFYTHNSHSGKTLLLLHMLRNNKTAKVAYFSPDEPATLILTKLTSLTHSIPAWELEARVAAGDRDAIQLLISTAVDEFPNLIVFDKTLTRQVLLDGYKEACDVWGSEADLTVIDYVDLVQGVDVVPAKFDIIKSFVHDSDAPCVAIHQASRSSGAEGREMTISSGNYGGEQHATFMIGVWRKKAAIMAELAEQRTKLMRTGSEAAADRIEELTHDLAIHEFTLTANVVKNKRPGGQLVDAIDFELAASTGKLFQMEQDDLPRQYLAKLKRENKQIAPATDVKPAWTEQEMDF